MSPVPTESRRHALLVPKVVLLPDACFFVRRVPVLEEEGAAPLAEQLDLALETLAPFPVAQLNQGYFKREGQKEALVFAAYRRRFSEEQLELWSEAAWVAPRFCALLGREMGPHSVLFYSSEESMTALYWGAQGQPERVLVAALKPEADEAERVRVREDLLRCLGTSVRCLELSAPPEIQAPTEENSYTFRAGTEVFTLPLALAGAMDVRPKDELARLRASQRRSLYLWRSVLGLVALLGLLLLGEGALAGGRAYQGTLLQRSEAQRPLVERVSNAQALAYRIDELSSKRLLAFEMLDLVSRARPRSIQFNRVSTTGIQSLKVEAQTSNAAEVSEFQAVLSSNSALENVQVTDLNSRDRTTRFTLLVEFKPGVLKPAQP